jgi:two-component system, chemotaxis family, protein-glutamate methylesterase/glutaminase
LADKKIKVLIVEDSSLVREALKSILGADSEIEIVGTAINGEEAIEKAKILNPDVITMDLNMPVMTGQEAIKHIMSEKPTPIIIVSGTKKELTIEALSLGAMDFVVVNQEIELVAKELIEKIKIASRISPLRRINVKKTRKIDLFGEKRDANFKVVAIGVSTGGPQALRIFLDRLPLDMPYAFLVVQHMSPGFIEGLVDSLNEICSLNIRIAKAGDTVKAGFVYFAPDNYHLKVGADKKIILSENTDKQIMHVPSIDILMKSCADVFDKNTIGIIMTGMGSDGVAGIKAIKDAGGLTIAQDKESSVIFGMNKRAIDDGYIDKVVSCENIADEIVRLL